MQHQALKVGVIETMRVLVEMLGGAFRCREGIASQELSPVVAFRDLIAVLVGSQAARPNRLTAIEAQAIRTR